MGYNWGNDFVQLTSLTTWPQTVYSPSAGEPGNLLTPGTYIVTLYGFIFFTTTTTTVSALTIGIGSNTSTNPVGFTNVKNVSVGISSTTASSNGTFAYWPCFVFTVTTTAYYYAYVTSSSGSLNAGSYGIGARVTSLVRIA